jgi:putative PIN family toxin of toxin-antitoxin system
VRVVLDVNVIVSALLAPSGTPARIVEAWQDGRFDILVSPLLLAELQRTLTYPRLKRRIAPESTERIIDWLARFAVVANDPADAPPVRSSDPDDDYLIVLAAAEQAMLVSGDDHLLSLRPGLPIHSPAEFLALLGA